MCYYMMLKKYSIIHACMYERVLASETLIGLNNGNRSIRETSLSGACFM